MALLKTRLDLAGTRAFTAPGAGPARREAIAAYTGDWLAQAWQAATGGRATQGVALAAVGSLGRRDAGPLSDLDLVLLHDGRALPERDLAALADRIWYPIWDAKVRLDHSVRTLGQCREVAGGDLAAAVGLLDIAPIAGDLQLVAAVRSTVAHDWRANARKRLPQLSEALAERHIRHGDLAQSIEPDLKEARGGLRDMTVLRALAAAWLADRPHGPVDEAYDALLDVRDALQIVTGRGRDRLGREDHDAVAALLGFPDADALLTTVSRSARTLAYALDSTMRRAGQSQRARVLRVGPRRAHLVSLGYGVFEHDGEAVLGGTPPQDAIWPLRAAVVAARAGLPLAPATLTNLAALPDLPTPRPPLARDLFADLLATGAGLEPVWEGLTQVGLVQRWLPEWAAVDSRPQRNPVHRHTVDRHLIETVVEAGGLVREVARPDLLLLAALLHDIGKIAGAQDHSHTGAAIAREILKRIGFDAADVAVVTRLVAEHLTLIELATRRDVDDPATIAAAWEAAGDKRDTFELLRALTIADAKAAGPKAWTDWRAGLLQMLCTAVLEQQRPQALPSPAAAEEELAPDVLSAVAGGEPQVTVTAADGGFTIRVLDRDRLGLFADTAGVLAAAGLTVRSAGLRTVSGVAIDTWLVEAPAGDPPSAERIQRGLSALALGDRSPLASLERRRTFASGSHRAVADGMPTRAFVIPGAAAGATVLEVRARDRLGLLGDLGRCFASAGLSVRSAHIATHAGQTLDTFYLTQFGDRPLSPAQVAATVAAVIDTCDGT
ncbi:[protein-PII] uridylyltransferase [Nostocoides veronense]|uniref:Bifunctional uridylyltransferase/uridylyl-removing enzyme n=1 Tax=Nostocoides veronense TaxID=330836 RepID=A0ABN2LYL4_9MICO